MTRLGRQTLAVAVGMLLVGCGVTFDAPKITMIVQDDRIVYADADGEEKLVGGETVFEFRNQTEQERRIVLARAESCDGPIPETLRVAESARDDDRIVGYSREIEPKETQFGAGGFGQKIDSISFHVYMEPGACYVAFDTREDRLAAWLTPGSRGQARS